MLPNSPPQRHGLPASSQLKSLYGPTPLLTTRGDESAPPLTLETARILGLTLLTLPDSLYSITKLLPNALVIPLWTRRSGEIAALKTKEPRLVMSPLLSTTGVVGTGLISYQRTAETVPLAMGLLGPKREGVGPRIYGLHCLIWPGVDGGQHLRERRLAGVRRHVVGGDGDASGRPEDRVAVGGFRHVKKPELGRRQRSAARHDVTSSGGVGLNCWRRGDDLVIVRVD